MNIHTLAACAVITASSVLATNAFAQTHTDSFTYQGEFMDNGEPANGFYDINFVVLNSPIGGSVIPGGSTTVANVEVVDGLFEAFVSFEITGSVFDSDQTRWLQINVREVGDAFFTGLSPRQRITPAPLANYALRSGSSLQDAYDNGGTIFTSNAVGLQIRTTSASAAQLNLGSTTGDDEEGRFVMYSETGGTMFAVQQDVSIGGGAFLQLARNSDGSAGMLIDGNAFGTDSTRVEILGNNPIVLTAADSGDNSVEFPNNAINSSEILNEVGASEFSSSPGIVLSDSIAAVDVVASVTINCPTSGFVLVLSSSELTINHVVGFTSTVDIGVSSSMTSLPSNGDIESRIPSSSASALYDQVVSTHGLFPANQGSNTFYLLGDKNYVGGSAQVIDNQLTAVFIPTNYGSIARTAGENLPDEYTPSRAPLSNSDIIIEQNAAIIANNQRLERELEAMKLQMQQILEQSQQVQLQQSQQSRD